MRLPIKKNKLFRHFRKSLSLDGRFMYLTILAFVFISSSALAISKANFIVPAEKPFIQNKKLYPPIPELKSGSNFPQLSAQGVLAVDLDSGVTLYEKNSETPLLPASTTKIVTALVALDAYQLDQILTVPKNLKIDGQKMGLFAGEEMKVKDLLYGLLVYSANDAAETLASDYPGGYEAFVSAMNTKAQNLNMKRSTFQNPVGLDGEKQTTTAWDLVRVSEVAMRNPIFAKIVGTKETSISDASGKNKYNLKNINELLGSVPGVLGVKTGWTENARENLVTYIERDNRKIMIAILGSQDRFGETKELINWIFQSYNWEEVVPTFSFKI